MAVVPRALGTSEGKGEGGQQPQPEPEVWQQQQQHVPTLAERLLRSCVPSLALSVALLLSSLPAGAEPPVETPAPVSSALDESLMTAAKRLEAGVDGALSRLPLLGGAAREEVAATTESAHQLIGEIWQVVDDNYMDARGGGFEREKWAALRDEALSRPYGDREAGFRAVREMLAKGLPSDPYSRFLTPGEFSKMVKYDVTGVGLNLGTGDDFTRKTGLSLPKGRENVSGGVWVLGLIKGAAADQGGISQGDQLLTVDGQPVDEQSPFQVATLISGSDQGEGPSTNSSILDPGSAPVTISVRKPDGRELTTTLERPRSVVPSPVSYKLQSKNGERVGYVKLSSFNARAHAELAAALTELQAKGADRFVLDLRDNRGGLVTEGIEVARLFLQAGDATIVQQLGGQRMGPQTVQVGAQSAKVSAPLMVLVNEATASASEILAGALKDNCRAVLVGRRTYGKGLIQSVYELSDASGLILTVGKYLTPRGTDIDLGGIKPDFRAIPSDAAAAQALEACRVVPPPAT